MISPEKYSQLMDLLHGKLSGQEYLDLENELATDAELRETYQQLELIEKVSIRYKLMEVETISQQAFKTYQKNQSLKKGLITIGALIGLSLSVYYFYSNDTTNTLNAPTKTTDNQQQKTLNTKEKNSVLLTEEEQQTPHKVAATRQQTTGHYVKESITTVNIDEVPKKAEPDTYQELNDTPTANPANEKPSTEPMKNPCELHAPESRISSVASCADKANGRVKIDIFNGHPPYVKSIFDTKKQQECNSFDLSPGNYMVEIRDSKNCVVSQYFKIESKICPVDYEFNPFEGQRLSFEKQSGLLRILNVSGQLYMETQLREEETFEWDGKSLDGNLLAGFYTYHIFVDGKQVKFGSITSTK